MGYFSKDISVGKSFAGVIASGGINKCDGNTILTIQRSVDVGRLGFKVMTDTNVVVVGKKIDELQARNLRCIRGLTA